MPRGENFRGRRPLRSGRKKGKANNVTRDVRQAVALMVQRNIEEFQEWLLGIKDPARRCEVFLKALAYHIPPLARVETSVNVKRGLQEFSDDELLALIGDTGVDEEKIH